MQQMIFIADLTACSTCFGYHYAYHQELESIIHVVVALPVVFGALVFQVVSMVWSRGLCVRFVCCCFLKQQPANQTPQAATTCIIL